jgi:hypothetical protein
MIAIGSIWKRRVTPATPDGWDSVRVVGCFQQAEQDEYVLKQADSFGEAISVTAADLEAAFDLEQPSPSVPAGDIYDTGSAWV